MRLLLVVNPVASAVKAKRRTAVESALSSAHQLDVVETKRRDHATALARQGAEGGVDVVVVLGGDGTLNEAANGLVATDTALAALPGGSTNVFARTIGMNPKIAPAAAQLVEALGRGSVRRAGVGVVRAGAGDRRFLFHVGIGYDAAVVEQVESRAWLKKRLGQAGFVVAALSTWTRHYDRSRPRMAVKAEGLDVDDGYFTICLNTNPYTFLGPRPLDVAPDAGLDRGLAVVCLRTLRLRPLLSVVGSALGVGKPVRAQPTVAYAADLDEVELRGHGPVPYQVDGDFLGHAEVLRFRHEPDALDLVVP